MKLQKWILVFTILFMSGMYFTGRTDRIPRAAVKVGMALNKADSLLERTWVLEQSDCDPAGLHEQDRASAQESLKAESGRADLHRGQVATFMLDPLLLDRPPPSC